MMTPENQRKHDEKLKRMRDALSLKVPDRVPIDVTGGQFMVNYAGFTMAEVIYDTSLEKIKYAIKKFLNDFDPDVVTDLGLYYFGEGPGHEMQGSKTMLISGMKDSRIGEDSIQQFIEFPTLFDEEFDEFFSDRTGWYLNKFLPRISTVMEPFKDFRIKVNHRGILDVANSFSRPDIREAIKRLWEISDFYREFRKKAEQANRDFVEMGYPSFSGGIAVVPFDKYSDTFRGTALSLMDLYDREEEIERYTNEFQQEMLETIRSYNRDGGRTGKFVSFMLHKGMDGFMNDEQYRKHYWRHLKELIETVVECGMIPNVFCEGKYMSRLDCLAEVPKGKVYYTFEKMDMAATKKKLAGIACIGGGFPSALLQYGTREQVIDECKRLLDACAPDGGYIFRLSAGLTKAKPENVEAMFRTVREYGKY